MRTVLFVALASALLASTACDNPAQEARIKSLENRVTALENAGEAKTQEEATQKDAFKNCILFDADQAYWNYVKNNGGKPVKAKEGTYSETYSAPQYVWDDARKRKEEKIEECKLLYGK